MIRSARVQDRVAATAGVRVLVDRLWPRGVARADAAWDVWERDVAPSAELRRWFAHDPARFAEFAHRYAAELAAPGNAAQALERLRRLAAAGTEVWLLSAARDRECNHATVLKRLLDAAPAGPVQLVSPPEKL